MSRTKRTQKTALYLLLLGCLALFGGYSIWKKGKQKELKTTTSSKKKVMVSGCYDLLHSGHVAFFKEAATYGNLYVRLGNDKNIEQLKNHKPIFPAEDHEITSPLLLVKEIMILLNVALI